MKTAKYGMSIWFGSVDAVQYFKDTKKIESVHEQWEVFLNKLKINVSLVCSLSHIAPVSHLRPERKTLL